MNYTRTIATLQLIVDKNYGSVVKYGNYVFVTDASVKSGFTANVYEFINLPADGKECLDQPLRPVIRAEGTFEDSGHAIEWCIGKAKSLNGK